MRQSKKGRSPRKHHNAPPIQRGLATAKKSGKVPKLLPNEPESVKFGVRASTEVVRAARVALAEAVLREMQINKMTPMADKTARSSGGRGYAQLDTIERMEAAHRAAMRKVKKGKQP